MTVVVRRATRDEGLVFVGIHLATCGLSMSSSSVDTRVDAEISWMRGLGGARHPTQGFVAEHDGALVGLVAAGPSKDLLDTGHVSRLHVDPTFLGRGVGTVLHDRAVAHLADRGFSQAILSLCHPDPMILGWCKRRGWHADPGLGTRCLETNLRRILP